MIEIEILYTASLSGEGAARALDKRRENRSSWKSKVFNTNLTNLQIKKDRRILYVQMLSTPTVESSDQERKTDPRTCMLPSPVHPLDINNNNNNNVFNNNNNKNLQIKKEIKTDPRTCMLPSPVHPLDSACANDPPSFQSNHRILMIQSTAKSP